MVQKSSCYGQVSIPHWTCTLHISHQITTQRNKIAAFPCIQCVIRPKTAPRKIGNCVVHPSMYTIFPPCAIKLNDKPIRIDISQLISGLFILYVRVGGSTRWSNETHPPITTIWPLSSNASSPWKPGQSLSGQYLGEHSLDSRIRILALTPFENS